MYFQTVTQALLIFCFIKYYIKNINASFSITLAIVIRVVLITYNDQADVETGFSKNVAMIVTMSYQQYQKIL